MDNHQYSDKLLGGPSPHDSSSYPNEEYYGAPSSQHPSYYPSAKMSSVPPPLPAHNQQHLTAGSSSESSPYENHPAYQTSYSSPPNSNSSSFESHGSSQSHGIASGVPSYVGFGFDPSFHHHQQQQHGPPSSYHHHPSMMVPPPPGYPPHCYHWSVPPPAPVELISNPKPIDVLSGRGGATNTHSGNRAFRLMIKKHQEKYLKSKKRDKPSVAAEVVRKIREKGGRFLRRCDPSFPNPHGEVLYYDIGDSKAIEKACQALREGAPGIRAKKRGKDIKLSSEDEKCISSEEGAPHDNAGDEKENETPPAQRDDNPESGSQEAQREPIFIVPSARLLRRSKVDPISLDQLAAGERDIYLNDFFPPNATFRKSEGKPHATNEYSTDEGRPVVGV